MAPRSPTTSARVAAFLSVCILVAAPSQAPALAGARPGDLWVVGDSITYVSAPTLRPRLQKTVTGQVLIDGVGGRPVADLDDLVDQELAMPGTPSVMVLALGTNPSPGWGLGDYQRVVESIPDRTVVVLVTVYRTPDTAGSSIAHLLARYSHWMRETARGRPNVCIADWRAAAQRHPEAYLVDGVHPTATGQRVWSSIIRRAVERCE
jgi:GDSL-like lipase/acylhydrolase family protein